MDNLKYPKADLMRVGANYIGSNIFNGVYWYIINGNNAQLSELNTITQRIIASGGLVKDIINIKRLDSTGGHVICINRDIYQSLANEMFMKISVTYPELPRLKENPKIEEIREKELLYFRDFIASQKNSTVDVYLYKTSGERIHTLMLFNKNAVYKKNITGFYLTEEDLEDANIFLSEINKKIGMAEQKELMGNKYGVRYTLTITQADFIKV